MHRTYRNALLIAVTLLFAAAHSASASTRGHFAPSASVAAADSATGCLQKGDKPGTFKLLTKDGKVYDVMSSKVDLSGHVGHTVTLSGDTMADTTGKMKGMKDSSTGGMAMKSAMQVSSMKMVSPTCS